MKDTQGDSLHYLIRELQLDPQITSQILACLCLFKKRKALQIAQMAMSTHRSPNEIIKEQRHIIDQQALSIINRYKSGYLIQEKYFSSSPITNHKSADSSTIYGSTGGRTTPHFDTGSHAQKPMVPCGCEISEFCVRVPMSRKIKQKIMGDFN